MDDRVSSAGECQVCETHHFLAGERPSAESRAGEGAKKIIAWIGGGLVELRLQVDFERGAFVFPGAAVVKDMNAPANPDIRFGFRNVEQIGQRTGLQGQREPAHDLD